VTGTQNAESVPPTWPDGTVRLPDAIERWLDGHFAGEKDDATDELQGARNVAAVVLWSLIHRQGDHDDDQAALDVLCMAAHGFVAHPAPIDGSEASA
jgi:hypothetical protein